MSWWASRNAKAESWDAAVEKEIFLGSFEVCLTFAWNPLHPIKKATRSFHSSFIDSSSRLNSLLVFKFKMFYFIKLLSWSNFRLFIESFLAKIKNKKLFLCCPEFFFRRIWASFCGFVTTRIDVNWMPWKKKKRVEGGEAGKKKNQISHTNPSRDVFCFWLFGCWASPFFFAFFFR